MNAASLSPRARWARAQVMPWLAAHPDGCQEPVSLTLQRLDDIGALVDLERAAELYAAGFAAGRAESEEELADLGARVTQLEKLLPPVLVDGATHRLLAQQPLPAPAPEAVTG